MLVSIVFVPLGVFFGSFFLELVQRGEFSGSGLTPLGYAVYGLPGAVSATCFGTVVLRISGMPWVWLGCVGVFLVFIAVFGSGLVVLVAIVWVVGKDYVQVAAVGTGMVVAFLALAYVGHILSSPNEPPAGMR